jgi:hypothetical protein
MSWPAALTAAITSMSPGEQPKIGRAFGVVDVSDSTSGSM